MEKIQTAEREYQVIGLVNEIVNRIDSLESCLAPILLNERPLEDTKASVASVEKSDLVWRLGSLLEKLSVLEERVNL